MEFGRHFAASHEDDHEFKKDLMSAPTTTYSPVDNATHAAVAGAVGGAAVGGTSGAVVGSVGAAVSSFTHDAMQGNLGQVTHHHEYGSTSTSDCSIM